MCESTLEKPEQYGTKTDILCGSMTIAYKLPSAVDCQEYWVYTDSRHDDCDEKLAKLEACETRYVIERELCFLWNELYRARRKPYRQEGVRIYDKLGHPHMSAGLHALIYAAFLTREDVVLYGFDNVRTGTQAPSVLREPGWAHYPDHNWPVERGMIPIIEKAHGIKVTFR